MYMAAAIPRLPFSFNPMEIAAIYRRVSTDKQDDSLELQERRTLDYAKFKGLQVGPTLTFSDPDTSGSIPIRERDGGRLLINRLAVGDVKHLVIAKLDRLGRDVVDGISTLEFCNHHGVCLHIVDLGGETVTTQGHVGRFILTVMFGVAEWERKEIGDRTRKQMGKLFDDHQLTGHIPFGWDCMYEFPDKTVIFRDADPIPAAELAVLEREHGGRPRKTLQANSKQQAVIHYIIRAVKNLCKLEHIANDLNNRGIKTKMGREWQTGNVHSVLNNRHTRRLLQQTTSHEIPPIQLLPAPMALLPQHEGPQCAII